MLDDVVEPGRQKTETGQSLAVIEEDSILASQQNIKITVSPQPDPDS